MIHEHCERRPHFDAGRFAKEFGDEGHREGWCLYHLGCKGPETYGNCSTLQFCDVGGVWPVAIGHPCYGCNEEGVGFHKGIHQLAHVENQTPRSEKPDVNMKEGGNVSAGAIGLLGGVVGLVAGVSVMAVRELGRQQRKITLTHGRITVNRRNFIKAASSGALLLGAAPSISHAAAENRPPIPGSLGMLYDSTLCVGCQPVSPSVRISTSRPVTRKASKLVEQRQTVSVYQ